MYQQNAEHFYAQFPYGIGCSVGPIEGQPGRLFQCNTLGPSQSLHEAFDQGTRMYAGKLDPKTMLVVSVEEYERAWKRLVEENRANHYFPNGEDQMPEDLYREAIYRPADEVVSSVYYWLGQ